MLGWNLIVHIVNAIQFSSLNSAFSEYITILKIARFSILLWSRINNEKNDVETF